MLGQVGHFFRFAKEDVPYGKQRYLTEAKRLLTVLDKALEGGSCISTFKHNCSVALYTAPQACAPKVTD